MRNGFFLLIVAACAMSALMSVHAEQMFAGGFEGPGPCVDVAAGDGTTFDVPSISITPQFRLNGKQFPVDINRYANFYLSNADGYQVPLGSTSSMLLAPVRVIPGLYDVIYEYVTGNNIPRNHGARLMRNLWLGADRTLRIDVSSVNVNAEFRHNGALFTSDAGNAGNLFLDGIYYGGEAQLGSTTQQQADLTLLAGAYRLIYRHGAGNSVPVNLNARLDRHDLDASGAHVFDVPSVLVNVTFRLNGAAFPTTAYERGAFTLGGPEGDSADLHDSLADTVQRRIVPGQYDVHWTRVAGGSIVPWNVDAVVAGPFDLTAAASILADVHTVEVSGNYLVNGAAPPATAYESGEAYVIDPLTGANTSLGQTHYQLFDARLVAQHYAIGYRSVAGASILPSNPDTVIVANWDPVATPERDIDIPVGHYQADLLLNGAAFPATAYESGSLFAQPLGGGPATLLGYTHVGLVSRNLLPGTYFVTYRLDAGGSIVPRNSRGVVAGDRVISAGPDTQFDTIAVTSVQIERDLTLDGTAFPAATNARLRFRAHHPFGDDDAYWGESMYGTASKTIIPGQYDVIYEHDSGTTIPQNNKQQIACWNIVPP